MSPFLTAEWRKLVMANYVVDPTTLTPFVPHGTELDFFQGRCYVSLVGFYFQNTHVAGLSIPFHKNFEEVNLRFYVRRKEDGKYKRGVVFIKEIVPKLAITFVANTIYGEKYETMPMSHVWLRDAESLTVKYSWWKNGWHSIDCVADGNAVPLKFESEAEFITEHFWGYTQLNSTATSEYEVAHPSWLIYPVKSYKIDVDFGKVYGTNFRFMDALDPFSFFLAEGSEIKVMRGRKLRL